MSVARSLWKAAFSRWRTPRGTPQPGYTLLLPVPGDLPVFLEIALSVCRRLDPTHRVRTLVIPDLMTDAMRRIVERERPTWPGGGLELVAMRRPDRWLPGLLKRPHANHWLQLINGVEHAPTTHALLHDADLFIADPQFHRTQFERCRDAGLACLGVHEVWDKWYAGKGRKVTATWELIFDVDWMRSFPPHEHLGHDATIDGERHTTDTTLLPQALTPPGRIDWHAPPSDKLIHFNYVICTYRYFQAAKGPYADDYFRVLLVRLLADLFDKSGWHYEVPSVEELARGRTAASAKVVYTSEAARSHYGEFRAKLAELMASGLLNAEQVARTQGAIGQFDSFAPDRGRVAPG